MQRGLNSVKISIRNEGKLTGADKDMLVNVEETLNRIETEMILISAKLKQMNGKKWSGKQSDWGNLKADVNEVLSVVRLSEVKRIFVRKFEQEIRLLSDFHMKRYQQSMFRLCFFCCPYEILRKLKYYKLIDEKFEISVSQVQRAPRQIYFYIHLLYVKLFVLLVSIADVEKIIDDQSGQTQQFRDPKAVGYINNDEGNKQEQLISEKNLVRDKSPQQRLKHHLKTLQQQLQQIKQSDWKDIIDIEQWCQHSYNGFIQINDDDPIQTFLQFKDCKFKTGHLFQQISSSSIDLRTCLIRRSKSQQKSYQYVIDSLHHDTADFKLRFWLSDEENTIQNNTSVQKYILLAMRIGVKEKLFRMANLEYKQKATGWIVHNYLHLKVKTNQLKNKNSNINNNQSSETNSFQSVSSAESITPQRFWWVTYGQELIKAIVEVAEEKKRQARIGIPQLRKKSIKKGSHEEYLDNSPQNNINKSKNTSPKTLNNTSTRPKHNTKQSKSNSNNESIETNKRLITMRDLDDNHTARQI